MNLHRTREDAKTRRRQRKYFRFKVPMHARRRKKALHEPKGKRSSSPLALSSVGPPWEEREAAQRAL
jgi:hypothetical protein